MTLFESILLGIVQGLTEFFPISSSAHLKLAQILLNIEKKNELLSFDLVCHLGTLFALIFYLRKEIFQILIDRKKWPLFIIALLPLIPIYFLLKPLIAHLSDPRFLTYGFFLTATLLFLSARKKGISSEKKIKHVVWIGFMQAMALIPGISRSGSTISTARLCGWSFREGAIFSYLLATPTMIGGELLHLVKEREFPLPLSCYLSGLLFSFLLGLLGVRIVLWIYEKQIVKPFAWYCLGLSLLCWGLFHG